MEREPDSSRRPTPISEALHCRAWGLGLVFLPKCPHVLGKCAAECFQKGVARLPGDVPTLLIQRTRHRLSPYPCSPALHGGRKWGRPGMRQPGDPPGMWLGYISAAWPKASGSITITEAWNPSDEGETISPPPPHPPCISERAFGGWTRTPLFVASNTKSAAGLPGEKRPPYSPHDPLTSHMLCLYVLLFLAFILRERFHPALLFRLKRW